MTHRRALISAVNWALSGLVLGVFGWAVHHYWGWQRLFAPWASVPVVLVVLVVAAQFASYSVRGYRVYYAVPEIPRGRWHDCLKLILLSNVINLMLPARTGEASFPVLLRRWFGVTLGRGAGTLLWLRSVDLAVLVVVALAVLGRVAFPAMPVGVVVALCAAGLAAPLIALPVRVRADRLLAGRSGKIAGLLRKVLDGIPAQTSHVLVDLGLAWAGWGLKLAALAVVFAQLADLSLAHALIGAIGGDVSTGLPVHAPGGFGTYEAGVVALVAVVADAGPALLAAAVNLHLLVLGIALMGGAYAWLTQPRRIKGASS
jgi:uncharacterized membrane protein YbhN (UPF0104 family)